MYLCVSSYGVGYHLTIVKVPDVADSHRLESIIRGVIPQCLVWSRCQYCCVLRRILASLVKQSLPVRVAVSPFSC